MKKYKAYGYGSGSIEVVEVERESESCVWIKGRRLNKQTDFESYFDSWEKAHKFLLKMAKLKVDSARMTLESANSKLRHIKGMKVPS